MTIEQLQELWEDFQQRYQKDFGQKLMSFEELMSVYTYRIKSRVGGAGYSMHRLIDDVTHSDNHAMKLRNYFKEKTGRSVRTMEPVFAQVLTDWYTAHSGASEREEYAEKGETLYKDYQDIHNTKKEQPYREKIGLAGIQRIREEEQREQKVEIKEKQENEIKVEEPEKEKPVQEAQGKEAQEKEEQEKEILPAEAVLKEDMPVQKQEAKATLGPKEEAEQIDPSRQSILDAFDAIRDTKVSRYGTRHDKEFDQVWDAVNEYETAVYKASLSKKEISSEIGEKLYSACRDYLALHLKTKKGVQSIDGQNTEDGRLRKQAIVKMLELMEKKGLAEFDQVSDRYIQEQQDDRKKVSLQFEQLKNSLADKSKVEGVPLEQKYYAELDRKQAKMRLQKQKEAAEFAVMSKQEREEQRKKADKNEFFTGYRTFLNQYPIPQKAELIKRINSNQTSVLMDLKNQFGKKNESLKKYLEHRIVNLQKIDQMTDRAERNRNTRKTEEPEIVRKDDGSISKIMMKNVEQPMMQKTFNGCWSVALSSLLKYRGVDLDQTTIRAYRPIKNLGYANVDTANNISNYVDLVQKVIPGAAVNEVEIFQGNYHGVKWTDEERLTQREQAKQKLKTALLTALDSDKGPVAFLCRSHYRTVLGFEEKEVNGVKTECVTLFDPMRSEKVELTMDELIDQTYLTGNMTRNFDEKGNLVNQWMGESYSFTMQWLKDLTDSKGTMKPDQSLQDLGVHYDQNGKLHANAILNNESTNAYKAVSWSLNQDITVRTYLPARMTLMQKKAEKERIPDFLGANRKWVDHRPERTSVKTDMTKENPVSQNNGMRPK